MVQRECDSSEEKKHKQRKKNEIELIRINIRKKSEEIKILK